MRYQKGKFGAYLRKTNWNRLIQDLGTIIIGVLVGIYFELDTPSDRQQFLPVALIILGVCVGVKVALYLSLLDFNRLKGQRVKKRGADINGMLEEIPVVVMGVAVAMISTPVVQRKFLFQSDAHFPHPGLWLSVILACILLLILLKSYALNFNGGPVVQLHKIRPFLARYDWNEVFHELASMLIGIGLGLYLFETGVANKPFQFLESHVPFLREPMAKLRGFGNWQGAEKLGGRGLDKLFSKWAGKEWQLPIKRKIPWKNKFSPQELINGWGEDAKPYLLAGLILMILCVILKILLYTRVFDANTLRNSLVGGRRG